MISYISNKESNYLHNLDNIEVIKNIYIYVVSLKKIISITPVEEFNMEA